MDRPEAISLGRVPLKTVRVHARNEEFRIVQMQGNLFVCSKAHGNCCCGWTEKGRAPVNTYLYEQEWEERRIRNKIHLSFTGCLGPCAVGNNTLLQISGRSIWFKDLNDDKFIPLIFDYIEALLKDVQTPVPAELSDHVFERFLPPPQPPQPTGSSLITGSPVSITALEEVTPADTADLERLDPVCLMEVDPATARWKSEFSNQNYYFCAPGCKKKFDKEPQAYL